MRKNTAKKGGFTLVEIMIVVAIIGLLAAIAIPNFVKARTTSQINACINNLRLIDAAKQQWALENRKQTTDSPQGTDLIGYLGHGQNGELPWCPADSTLNFTNSYGNVIGNVGTKAAFRVGTTDAEFLAKQFEPTFNAADLENMPNRSAVLSLLVNGSPTQPFTIETVELPKFDFSRTDALKELSYRTFGRDREQVEADIRRRFGQ